MQTHELFEEGDSIHVRHFHIQSEHVWLQVFDFLSCNQRIRGRGHHLEYRIFLKDCRKQLAHKRRVVNDQHANLSCDGHKGSPTSFVLSSSDEALLRSSCHHLTKPYCVRLVIIQRSPAAFVFSSCNEAPCCTGMKRRTQ